MMHFSNFANASGQIKVEEWVKLAHENQVPAFIDAAADTPPVSNLWEYAKMGYDLIAFSGGKAIRGPQCAGLLLGKKELIANALLNSCPHEDTLCRPMKVGKEEIVGMVKALECFLKDDHVALDKEWWSRLDVVSREITAVPGVTTSFDVPDIANHVPHMNIFWDPRKISLTPREASGLLRKGDPSIVLGSSEHGLGMNSFMLQPGEEKIIAAQLVKLFKSHSA
jgi:L-seryl-tRNA(Ser) seleniumtransferase